MRADTVSGSRSLAFAALGFCVLFGCKEPAKRPVGSANDEDPVGSANDEDPLLWATTGDSEPSTKPSGPPIVEPSESDVQSVPPDSPLLGEWYEVGRFPCNELPEFIPDDPIRELIVWRAGFRLTHQPFESHVDYHAVFRIDDGNVFTIVEMGGYSIPEDVDRVGHFELATDTLYDPEKKKTTEYKVLILRDMWLGSSVMANGRPPSCGHRFIPKYIAHKIRRAELRDAAAERKSRAQAK